MIWISVIEQGKDTPTLINDAASVIITASYDDTVVITSTATHNETWVKVNIQTLAKALRAVPC